MFFTKFSFIFLFFKVVSPFKLSHIKGMKTQINLSENSILDNIDAVFLDCDGTIAGMLLWYL